MEAHDRGQASLSGLASRFGVSRGWAWKISAARKRSGQMERPPYRAGRHSQLDRAVLAELLDRHADWTLRQLQAAMEERTRVRFSQPHLWRVLKKMGFRLKKSHSTPPSATAKPIKSDASRSSKKFARSRRSG